jgi:hypothetical protein
MYRLLADAGHPVLLSARSASPELERLAPDGALVHSPSFVTDSSDESNLVADAFQQLTAS